MKEIYNIVCKNIISEPGDCTRYDFIVIQDYDDFCIMPYKSTFSFPQRLNYYEAKEITDIHLAVEYINNNSKLKSVNPNTLLEVCKRIVELYEE